MSLQQLLNRHLHSPATYHMHETVDAHLNIMPVRSFSLNLCNLFCICLSLCWSLSLSLYLSRRVVVESEMYLNWVTNDSNLCKRSKNGLLMPSTHHIMTILTFFRRWFHNRTCIDEPKKKCLFFDSTCDKLLKGKINDLLEVNIFLFLSLVSRLIKSKSIFKQKVRSQKKSRREF